MNKRLNYQFVSPEKEVAIVILSPRGGIECFCHECKELWRTAKYTILVVNKHKLYHGCDWFPGKDDFPMPQVGKFKWVHTFELVGPRESSEDYCRKTDVCRQRNEYSTPVLSTRKEAEKFKNEILDSWPFKKEGSAAHSTMRTTWSKRWPKYEKGVLKIAG
jgi:hypothetical protein